MLKKVRQKRKETRKRVLRLERGWESQGLGPPAPTAGPPPT